MRPSPRSQYKGKRCGVCGKKRHNGADGKCRAKTKDKK
jgi:hypothetical protein